MTTAFLFGGVAATALLNYPSTEIGQRPVGPVLYGRQRLSTDPIGNTTLTLTNVVSGSRYRVERASDGSLAEPTANAEGTAAGSTVAITLDVFANGNSNNDLVIKVRKASAAPYYRPYDTQVTISSNAQSVFISQLPDE